MTGLLTLWCLQLANRSYNWECVVWADNLESKDQIFDFRVKGFLSPLHDQDGGKAHYHWIMCFDSLKSYDQIMEMIKDSGLDAAVNTVRYVRDLTSSVRYLCHLDERKKVHYDPAYVECIGGTNFSKYMDFETDRAEEDLTLIQLIRKYYIVSYAQLVNYCLFVKKQYYRSVVGRCGFWSAYLRSLNDSKSIEIENMISEREGKNEDL